MNYLRFTPVFTKNFLYLNSSINHPADMDQVIGIGGLNDDDETIASYSSRGMTNTEI